METTNFKDVGFLSSESLNNEFTKEIKQASYFSVGCKLNEIAQKIINKIVIHPDDRKEVYATLYFQRQLSHYQSMILLAERGMSHQMEIMLRCILGILFDLRAFTAHEDVFDALINGDDDKRREVLENLEQAQQLSPTFTQRERAELQSVISSVDGIDRDDFKVFMKAELAGMLNEYRTTYTLLTESVHASLNSLNTDINFSTDSDTILEINSCTQCAGEIAELLMTGANYLLEALETIRTIFPNANGSIMLDDIKSQVQKEWQGIIVAVKHR